MTSFTALIGSLSLSVWLHFSPPQSLISRDKLKSGIVEPKVRSALSGLRLATADGVVGFLNPNQDLPHLMCVAI